jgi:hypothetical protein
MTAIQFAPCSHPVASINALNAASTYEDVDGRDRHDHDGGGVVMAPGSSLSAAPE